MQTEGKKSNRLLTGGIGCLAALMISCGLIFASTFFAGPMLMGVPGLGDRITAMIFCPGAISTSLEQGNSTQTTTSPTATYGHTVTITCKMPDGSEKVVSNEETALGNIGGSFGVGAVLGICLSIPILLIALVLMFWKKK